MTKGELIAAMEDFKDDIEVRLHVAGKDFNVMLDDVTEIHENGAQDASGNFLLLS